MQTFRDSRQADNKSDSSSLTSFSSTGQRSLKSIGDIRSDLETLFETLGGEEAESPEIAAGLNDAGLAYLESKNYTEAQSFLGRALDMYKRLAEDEENPDKESHADIITEIRKNLGITYLGLKDYRKAISSFKTALSAYIKIYGEHTPNADIAELHSYLGLAYLSHTDETQNDYPQAVAELTNASTIYTTLYTEVNEDLEPHLQRKIADTRYYLGLAHQKQGNHEVARDALILALMTYKILFKESLNQPEIAATQYNIGLSYQAQNSHPQAISCFNQALTLYSAIYHDEVRIEVAELLHHLGDVHLATGNKDLGKKHLSDALTLYQAIFRRNPDHPSILAVKHSLGMDSTPRAVSAALTASGIFKTKPTVKQLRSYYTEVAGMFNASGGIFKKGFDHDVDSAINALKLRARKKPGGASDATLQHFGLN